MNTVDFSFDELPLLTEGDIVLALVTGKAEIVWDTDGTWSISNIYLEGYDTKAKAWKKEPVQLDKQGEQGRIWHMIYSRLTDKDWSESIDDVVAEDMHTEMPWPAYASLTAAE